MESTSDFNDYLQWIEALDACKSVKDLEQICRRIAHQFDFDYFVFGAYFPKLDEVSLVNGYPEEWRKHYDASGYIHADPTVIHCAHHLEPLNWDEIVVDRRDGAGRKLMNESKESGLVHGLSVPVHGVGSEWGMMSLASSRTLTRAQRNSAAYIQLVLHHVHETLKRVAPGADADTPIRLTSREQECLVWTAKGKTAWEISKILQISESTVIFHLKNSIKKMEVTNRTQAVAKAISLSLITQL